MNDREAAKIVGFVMILLMMLSLLAAAMWAGGGFQP